MLSNAATAAETLQSAPIAAPAYELDDLTEKEIKLVEDSQIESPKAQRETRPEPQADLVSTVTG